MSDQSSGRFDEHRGGVQRRPPKPAGWYRDPGGRFDWRYFDGRWTDEVMNEGDDRTYVDPVPRPRRDQSGGASRGSSADPRDRAARRPHGADTTQGRPTRSRRLPTWLLVGGGVLVIAALVSTLGKDDKKSSPSSQPAAAASRTTSRTGPRVTDSTNGGAVSGAAGAPDEVSDIQSCSLIDDSWVSIELHNGSSKMSSYMIDLNFLDADGTRLDDTTSYVNHVRPDERVAERNAAQVPAKAKKCEIAKVERMAAESPDNPADVTCEVSVNPAGLLEAKFVATNTSSKLSDFFVSAALMRAGVRVGTAEGIVKNVKPGQQAPSDGLGSALGSTKGLGCQVVHVERTATEG